MGLFTPGTPRIALLNGAGTKLKTLYLPPPDTGPGLGLEWIEKAFDANLIDGSESCRRLGWIPQLVLKWANYNDVLQMGNRPFGNADGNVADINALLALLDTAPGLLKVSPGPSAGGFVVNKTTVSPMGVVSSLGIATGLQITLRGKTICSTKTLGAW